MPTTKYHDGQVSIPEEIREAAKLQEGEELEVEITAVGILLRTSQPLDPDQAWFWTKEWQAGEREADEEINAGRGRVFYSDEEFLASLEEDALDDADV
jgi:AbrB family looped-hinge helix DNA binding protein